MKHVADIQGTDRFVAQYREIVTKYAQASISQNTQRAYRSAWKRFLYWTKEKCVSPLPVAEDFLGVYLATMAEGGASLSSIELALAAIQKAHSLKGLPSPAKYPFVRTLMGGIRRNLGHEKHQKDPATADIIRKALSGLGDSLIETRNRSLILLGFAGAFRRSELAGLSVEDLSFRDEGLLVKVRRSKTDQEGHGWTKAIFLPPLTRKAALSGPPKRDWNARRSPKDVCSGQSTVTEG